MTLLTFVRRGSAWLLCPLALAAASLPSSSHHGPDGFHNNYPHGPRQRLGHSPRAHGCRGVTECVERAAPHVGGPCDLPHPGGRPRDPHGPPILAARVDVVVITHNHYDHLDVATVKALAALPHGSPLFLVPLGLKAWFADQGIERVEELDWWQHRDAGGARFTLVPVQHWSQRTLLDRNRTLWGGWAMELDGLKIVHTGDLGLSKDTQDIGERLGPFDLALIPIGAYEPRWFMKTMHVNVPEAMQVRTDLRAARAIGMHWGTFEGLTDEPLDEPPKVLAKLRDEEGLAREVFDVMKIGETRAIAGAREGGPTRR